MSTKYSSDDSKDTNYVRKMAKHFDTIYADSTTYTNTMQANWWLNTSAFGPYCDDTPSDTDTEHEPFNECTSQMANHTNDHEYGIEVAKIAYDHQTYNATANQRDKRDSKKPSFYDKIDFLRFPNRPHAQPLTYDHPAGYFHVYCFLCFLLFLFYFLLLLLCQAKLITVPKYCMLLFNIQF